MGWILLIVFLVGLFWGWIVAGVWWGLLFLILKKLLGRG